MPKRLARDDFVHMLSFGTFKPVGYTVLAYEDEAAARAALARLVANGFHDDDVLSASSANLFPRLQEQMADATGMVAAQGYECVLMKRYLEIARTGAWWLMIWSPHEADVARVKSTLALQPVLSAAHYGRMMIEDLSEPPVGVTTA